MKSRLDIFFAEESCPIPDTEVDQCVHQYAETVKEAIAQSFSQVRYEKDLHLIQLTPTTTFFEYCRQHHTDLSIKVILTTHTKPYYQDDSTEEKQYIDKGCYIAQVGINSYESFSLSAALMHNSVAIGFANNDFDKHLNIPMHLSANTKENSETVLCITHKSQFDSDEFIIWAESRAFYPVILPTHIHPTKKSIHLSPHHGISELTKFANKLILENYIVEVVNSIDRNSREKKLIHNMHENLIELRLLDGQGYGLVVSTTARNRRELSYIACLLRQKYSLI